MDNQFIFTIVNFTWPWHFRLYIWPFDNKWHYQKTSPKKIEIDGEHFKCIEMKYILFEFSNSRPHLQIDLIHCLHSEFKQIEICSIIDNSKIKKRHQVHWRVIKRIKCFCAIQLLQIETCVWYNPIDFILFFFLLFSWNPAHTNCDIVLIMFDIKVAFIAILSHDIDQLNYPIERYSFILFKEFRNLHRNFKV